MPEIATAGAPVHRDPLQVKAVMQGDKLIRRTAEGECQHAYSSFLKARIIDEKGKTIFSRATCQPRSEGFDFSRCYFN
jgi:hypothetical protein